MRYLDEVDSCYAGQIPYLGKNEIASRVEALLGECWDGCLPIDIEAICDFLGISIVPVQGLRAETETDAYLAVDFKTIYVDWSGYTSGSARYRFSVAHELGHYVLHQMYYPCDVGSFEEWQCLISNLGYVEYQANFFAGSLLAPEAELVMVLNTEFDGSFVRNCWCRGRDEFRRALGDVRRTFKVSEQVLARRMRDLMPGAERFDEIAMGLRR